MLVVALNCLFAVVWFTQGSELLGFYFIISRNCFCCQKIETFDAENLKAPSTLCWEKTPFKIKTKQLRLTMNKFCSQFIKQTLQSSFIRGSSQFGRLNGIACCSTEAGKTVPVSKNPKHKTSPRITLLSSDDKMEITTLDQAKKIAERRQLKLVSIIDFDTKTSRPVYKWEKQKSMTSYLICTIF